MRCGELTNEQQLDLMIKEVVENLYLQPDKSDEIYLNFFSVNSSLQASYFAGAAKKEVWERWVLPLRLSQESDSETSLQKSIPKIALEAGGDHVPPIYEGMKCYQFEIEHLKPTPKAQSKSSTFFGGLLGKFTGK
jgi:hypothetical protein